MQREFNLLAAEFDPESALAVERVCLPFPTIAPLDNLSQCRRLLPEGASAAIQDEHHLRSGSKHVAARRSEHGAAEAFVYAAPAEAVDASSTASKGSPSNTSASMPDRKLLLAAQWACSFAEGPVGMLRALKRQRVRVVIRRQFGLRSLCEGELQLFDRHFNLVLLHATESAVMLQPPHSSSTDGESWPHAMWERRAIGQILVRGDCVVSVSAATHHHQPTMFEAAFEKLSARAARRAIAQEADAGAVYTPPRLTSAHRAERPLEGAPL